MHMNNQKSFTEASKQKLLDNSSRLEAEDKIARLKKFYKDPYEDGSERWYRAEFALDYLCKHKEEGSKRKDGYTEDILHEIDLLLLQKGLFEAGKLPRKVTYAVIDGQRVNIPKEAQSIEHLFCTTATHDIDEDDPDASIDEYRLYITDRIINEDNMPSSYIQRNLDGLEVDCRSMEIITFGRKMRDRDGNIIKQETHDGDRNKYMDAIESSWITASIKPADRLSSLTSRYGELGEVFPITKDMSHLDETYRLFRSRQTLENMANKYPEMAGYFNVMNAKLDVAVRCLECVLLNHPLRLQMFPDSEVNPETAKIDISRQLKIAVEDCEYLDRDVWLLERMVRGFEKETERYPVLRNIVSQIGEQFEEAVENRCRHNQEPDNNNNLTGDNQHLIS